MGDTITRLFVFGARHKAFSGLIILLVTLATGAGLSRLHIDTSLQQFIDRSSPLQADYDRLMGIFGSDKVVLVLLRHEALFAAERLAALESLTVDLERLPFVERVDSLFTTRSLRAVEDGLEAAAVVEYVPVDAEESALFRERALYSPLAADNLISADGEMTAVVVTLVPDVEAGFRSREITDAIEVLLVPLRSVFAEAFQVSTHRAAADMRHGLLEDMLWITPLNAALLVLLLTIFLGTWVGALIPLLLGVITIIWTFGMMGYLGIPLNILTGLLPTLVLVVCSTEDTHIIASYLDAQEAEPDAAGETLILATARHVGVPVVLTALTTVIGFFANVFNDLRIVGGFAVAAALAMAANAALTYVAVPLLLDLIRPRRSRRWQLGPAIAAGLALFTRLAGRFIRLPLSLRAAAAVNITVLLFCAGAMLFISRGNDPLSFFREDHALLRDAETAHRELAGMQTFFVALETDEPAAFKDPARLQSLAIVADRLAEDVRVDLVISLPDFIRLVHREQNGGDPTYHRVPASRDLIEQYLLFFQRRDLERHVSADFSRTSIAVRHNIRDSEVLNDLVEDTKELVARHMGGSVRVTANGLNLLINASAAELTWGMLEGVFLLMAAIGIIMAVMFRSAVMGAIAILVNVLPVAGMFALMALTGISLNPATAAVATIALGIAVDDTIHILFAYRTGLLDRLDSLEAAEEAVRREVLPAVATSISLVVAFCTFLLSNFTIVSEFGLLVAVTLLLALATDLLLTPMLLARVQPIGLWEQLDPRLAAAAARSPLFAGLPRRAISNAILLSHVVQAHDGEEILKVGGPDRYLYIVLQGCVRIRRGPAGRHQVLSELQVGEIFGEVTLLTHDTQTADAVAHGETVVAVVDPVALTRTAAFHPRVAATLNLNLSRILAERLRTTTDRLLAVETAW